MKKKCIRGCYIPFIEKVARSVTIALFLLVCCIGNIVAQGRIVSGVVIDNVDGVPLGGVTVVIKGTNQGIVTNANGEYSLSVPDDNATLVFSYVGFFTQEFLVGNQRIINVTLREDTLALEEVVVVGYGTQKKVSVTGAVSTIQEGDLKSSIDGNVLSRLQGRVAGVTIINDNIPGGSPEISIRGVGSINSNNPLYVVDGVPVTGGINHINPNDIINMTVLKDASSSAIYGSRAANGVIIIETNRGKGGRKVNFSVRSGIQRATNKLDLLNTKEYGELLWLQFKNAGLSVGDPGWGDLQYGYGPTPVIPDYILPNGGKFGEVNEDAYSWPSPYNAITLANKEGTDWYDAIFKVAPFQEYNLTLSGSSDKNNYSISTGYLDQQGIVRYTYFDRYNFRANSDFKVTNWLELSESLSASFTDRVSTTNNSEYSAVAMSHRAPPIVPIYDIKGNYAGSKIPGTGNFQSPLAELERGKDNYTKALRLMGNFSAKITYKNFLFTSLIGINFNSSRSQSRTLLNPEYTQARSVSSLSQSYSGAFQYNWVNTLNYNISLKNHNIRALVGTEAVDYFSESLSASRSDYVFEDLDYMIINAGTANINNGGSFDRWALFSYIGRLNYDYSSKYLLELTIRRDGSSRFIGDNRWGVFPAFSAGWRISEEKFMKNISAINDLKFRFGWGQNGNDNVGNYNAYSTYRSHGSYSYYNMSGNSITYANPGYYQNNLGNPNAKWEATTTTNFGIDMTLLKNSLEINLDVYQRLTSNMLYTDTKPVVYGGTVSLPSINIGEMKNTGFDLLLTYRGRKNDFNYTIRGNISHYRNEVLKLNDNPNEIRYGTSGTTLREEIYTATKAGYPISSFYGYRVEGIFNTWEEVNAWAKYNPSIDGVDSYSRPGVLKFKDINGDGIINADDRDFIGSPHPDFTYGLNFDFVYKNWNLTMFFQGSQGNQLTNYINRWTQFNLFEGNRKVERLYESWTQERYEKGSKITLPIAITDDALMQKQSTFFVEDASYFRMKDLSIGYTLPSKIASKLNMDRLQFNFQITNVFTITKYGGLDPEVLNMNNLTSGVDVGIYPTSQNILLGININF